MPISKYFIAFLLIIIHSCTPKPCIHVSDTLKETLGYGYRNYVNLLNRSCNNDLEALLKFLKTDKIEGAGGYSHGCVLVKLLEQIGDSVFYSTTLKLNDYESNTLKNYFVVGFDTCIDRVFYEAYQKKYPLTLGKLKIFESL